MTIARDLARVHTACFTTPPPWSEATFQSFLSAESTVFLSDRVAETLHGFLLGRVVLDEAELLTIAIDPSARRAGIAAALLHHFQDVVRARGATTVFLEVSAHNVPALALYEKAGFHLLAKRKGYYTIPGETPRDALILHKSL